MTVDVPELLWLTKAALTMAGEAFLFVSFQVLSSVRTSCQRNKCFLQPEVGETKVRPRISATKALSEARRIEPLTFAMEK